MLMPLNRIILQLLKMVSRKTKSDCRKHSTPKRPNSIKSEKLRITSKSQL